MMAVSAGGVVVIASEGRCYLENPLAARRKEGEEMGAWSDPTRATIRPPVLFGGFSGMEGTRSDPNCEARVDADA
jgi:hypothetical protein